MSIVLTVSRGQGSNPYAGATVARPDNLLSTSARVLHSTVGWDLKEDAKFLVVATLSAVALQATVAKSGSAARGGCSQQAVSQRARHGSPAADARRS